MSTMLRQEIISKLMDVQELCNARIAIHEHSELDRTLWDAYTHGIVDMAREVLSLIKAES